MTADEAVADIPDGATVALVGGGFGLVEAADLHEAIERRFLATGHPRDLVVTHALGLGDRKQRGLNRFAHTGMVRRVIGGFWAWSPRMQEMARNNEIEAYALPGGVMMQLMRDIGAGRPGLITKTGLGTYVDPRLGGGRFNDAGTADLVEVFEVDGEEWLRYKTFPVDVAMIRGSRADTDGNVTLEWEAANVDMFSVALAARNSGGKVLVQVNEVVEPGVLPAHAVEIPAPFVDAVVHVPDQPTTYAGTLDLSMAGATEAPLEPPERPTLDVRNVIGARAALELVDDAVVNFGFGMPDAVSTQVDFAGDADRYQRTIEHGTYGGRLLQHEEFGFARNPTAMIDGPSQFDFYNGGGLDIAFLGFGEIDRHGNVNVSMLGGNPVGPGGFIDIAQSARKVVFCGTFDTRGTDIALDPTGVTIRSHGQITKFVDHVAQITFSGPIARELGREVVYVTERAVFELGPEGLVVVEVAPGVDLQSDVLDRLPFAVSVSPDLGTIPLRCYSF